MVISVAQLYILTFKRILSSCPTLNERLLNEKEQNVEEDMRRGEL